MPGAVWALAEVGPDGLPTRLSLEAATAARSLAAAGGAEAAAILVDPEPASAAAALAGYVPRVLAVAAGGSDAAPDAGDGGAPAVTIAAVVAALVAGEAAARVAGAAPDVILLGATPEGRTVAGILAARLGRGVLGNAVGVAWGTGDDGAGGARAGPRVEMSVLGGRAATVSAFADGRGIVTLRPGAVTAAPAEGPGTVALLPAPPLPASAVRVVGRADAASRVASIEEARVVVAGGRGLGGPDGVALLRDLADAIGGVVAATRAAVDAGWLPYAVQIGQTGKTVRPAVYFGIGLSGAIQHRVGMQDAETIVAVNRDPDAPLAEHADLYVVGDLFEVVPALVAELRARRG